MDQGAASSDLIPRFGALIGRIKQAVADGAGRDTRRLGVLSVLLWGYLGRALQRLAVLETRRAAGTLRPYAPTDRAAGDRRPRGGTVATTTATPGGSGARIPYGPVLLRFNAAHLASALERMVAEPEMQALLAAAPQAGRVLRPLWRMLSTDPPPPPLRLPPRKRRPRPAIPSDRQNAAKCRPTGRTAVPPRARRVSPTGRGAWWMGARSGSSSGPSSGPTADFPSHQPVARTAPPPDW